MNALKIISTTILLSLFASACQSKTGNVVEVMLVSNIDEARGYCLDIAGGKGANAPLDKGLQAHTCYNYSGEILEDQGFDPGAISSGQFRISYFDVCMSAPSFSEGAELSLAQCDQSDAQKFSLQANGQLVAQMAPNLCVTVSSSQKKEGRGGEPVHVMRPISLELCDESKKGYQTWTLNELSN